MYSCTSFYSLHISSFPGSFPGGRFRWTQAHFRWSTRYIQGGFRPHSSHKVRVINPLHLGFHYLPSANSPQKPNAVADGGIYWHRKPLVEAHAADRFYGIEVWVRHPDPNKRPVGEREIVQSGGEKFIRYGFRVLLDGASFMAVYPTAECWRILKDEVFLDGETKPKFNFSHAVDKSHFDVKAELYSAERGADTHWVRDAKGMSHVSGVNLCWTALKEISIQDISSSDRLPYPMRIIGTISKLREAKAVCTSNVSCHSRE